MRNKARAVAATVRGRGLLAAANPFAGSSLVPMLVIGLVLTLAGMIAALALS